MYAIQGKTQVRNVLKPHKVFFFEQRWLQQAFYIENDYLKRSVVGPIKTNTVEGLEGGCGQMFNKMHVQMQLQLLLGPTTASEIMALSTRSRLSALT